ncbi:putative membrane protein [Wickerhamomyces ciferrii]|uniref:Membrane protein n=1 Tax=Wickerhamomyces ciferrii (strain ATCC 14091 / BCRC 22168 / CBS 111 / JCM 3599 / NBRC 0793 / NRRL Y-1031 F-60-10) TaxID=1206466 RepID=K0KNL9_WICCF|nr:uncharacterized protein BN7_2540 [Wickerhamomyces ciferrii]CCH42994.1 putative membrane protein [Wickerhamomyces ciferrii]
MRVNFGAYIAQIILLAGFYWIEADTSDISGAPDISRWTFWGLSSKDGKSNKREQLAPAYPFSPVDNFDTTENVPKDFQSNEKVYYYLSRFSFAFFWIALAFVGVSLLISIFSVFSYSVIKVNSWLTTLALLFDAGAVAFITAVAVLGRSAFKSDNKYVHLGPALLGIAWASVAILIILFFLTWGELIAASYKKHRTRVQNEKAEENNAYVPPAQNDQIPAPPAQQTQYANEDPYATQKQENLNNTDSGIKFFKIRRHNKEDGESV